MITNEPSLGRGNIKVGPIPTFSLPSRFSCPGATPWCLDHCYALRFERIWPNCRTAYSRNLVLTWNTRRFVRDMLRKIPQDLPHFRIHVSGDFYSKAYSHGWKRIAQMRPHTQFWAYTRSWMIPELQPALEELRALRNVHMFASVDPDMPDPPTSWRKAYLDIDPRADGLACLHQDGKAENCHECGYCFRAGTGNVVFKVH